MNPKYENNKRVDLEKSPYMKHKGLKTKNNILKRTPHKEKLKQFKLKKNRDSIVSFQAH